MIGRLRALEEIAAIHPDMPIRDALTATHATPVEGVPLAPLVARDSADETRWAMYAAEALNALVRRDTGAQHAAAQASLVAEAMMAEHTKRWPK